MGVLLKSILLPVVWWSISIGAMLYHRGLVVSTEFLSGVHDWPTYRTSSYKFLGAIFGFLGYNGVLFSFVFLVAVLNLSGNIQNQTEIEQLWLLTAGLFAASILSYLFARFFLRRMP